MLYIHDDIYKYLIILLSLFFLIYIVVIRLYNLVLKLKQLHPKDFNAFILHDSTYSE